MNVRKCLTCRRRFEDHFFDGKEWHPVASPWMMEHGRRLARELEDQVHVLVNITVTVAKA